MDNKNSAVDARETAKILPRCLICGEVPAGGIRDGIKMKKGFICSHCERIIVSMEPGSKEYEDVIGKLKVLLT